MMGNSRPLMNGIPGRLPISEVSAFMNIFPQPSDKFFVEIINMIDDIVFTHNVSKIKK